MGGLDSALATRNSASRLGCRRRIRRLGRKFASADDKAVGGCTEVVKREASDEGQRTAVRGVEDFNVAGGNDLGGLDKILKIAGGRLEGDGVAEADVAERAEECVTVAGESDVAGISWQSCLGNVADSVAQNRVGIALDDDGFEVKTRNLDFADDAAFDERGHRKLRAGSSLLQVRFELCLFGGLEGVGVYDGIHGVAEGAEAEDQTDVRGGAQDHGACATGTNWRVGG